MKFSQSQATQSVTACGSPFLAMNQHGMPYFLEFFRSMFSFRGYSLKNLLHLRLVLITSLSANCSRLYASGCFFTDYFTAYALPFHYASSIWTSTTKIRHLWLANFSPNLETVSSVAANHLFTQTLRDNNWCTSTKCQCCETAYCE